MSILLSPPSAFLSPRFLFAAPRPHRRNSRSLERSSMRFLCRFTMTIIGIGCGRSRPSPLNCYLLSIVFKPGVGAAHHSPFILHSSPFTIISFSIFKKSLEKSDKVLYNEKSVAYAIHPANTAHTGSRGKNIVSPAHDR